MQFEEFVGKFKEYEKFFHSHNYNWSNEADMRKIASLRATINWGSPDFWNLFIVDFSMLEERVKEFFAKFNLSVSLVVAPKIHDRRKILVKLNEGSPRFNGTKSGQIYLASTVFLAENTKPNLYDTMFCQGEYDETKILFSYQGFEEMLWGVIKDSLLQERQKTQSQIKLIEKSIRRNKRKILIGKVFGKSTEEMINANEKLENRAQALKNELDNALVEVENKPKIS